MLLAHTGQDTNFAFSRELLHAFKITNLVGAPDESDGFGTKALNFQQLQHGGPIFLEQIGVKRKPALG